MTEENNSSWSSARLNRFANPETRWDWIPKFNRKFFNPVTRELIIFFAFFLLLSTREDVSIGDESAKTTVQTSLFIYFSNEPVKYLQTLVNTYSVQDTSLSSTCSKSTVIVSQGHVIDAPSPSDTDCSMIASVPEWVYGADDRRELQASYGVEAFVVAVNAGFQSVNLTCATVDNLAVIVDPTSLVCRNFEEAREKCDASAQARLDFNAYFGASLTAFLPLVLWSSRFRDFLSYSIIAAWGFTLGAYRVEPECNDYTLTPVAFVLACFSVGMLVIKTTITLTIRQRNMPLYDREIDE
jgi:hypothetical protein